MSSSSSHFFGWRETAKCFSTTTTDFSSSEASQFLVECYKLLQAYSPILSSCFLTQRGSHQFHTGGDKPSISDKYTALDFLQIFQRAFARMYPMNVPAKFYVHIALPVPKIIQGQPKKFGQSPAMHTLRLSNNPTPLGLSAVSDELRQTVHARGPVTAKARSPSDERRVAGTTRADDDADRSRRRDVTSATG